MNPRGALAHARLCTFFPDCPIFLFRPEHWHMAPMDLSGRYERFGIIPPDNSAKKLCLCPEILASRAEGLSNNEFTDYMVYWESRLDARIAAVEAGEDLIIFEAWLDLELADLAVGPIATILEAP